MTKEELKQMLKDNLLVNTKVCNIAWGHGDLITEVIFDNEVISRSINRTKVGDF